MNAQVLVAIISQILANLPAYVKTARDLMHLINDAYERVSQALGDGAITDEDLKNLVDAIVANSARIQSIPEAAPQSAPPPPTDPT